MAGSHGNGVPVLLAVIYSASLFISSNIFGQYKSPICLTFIPHPTPMSTILVTGATGKQGGAIIAALLALPKPPITIHVLTRFPKSPSAVALASKSSTITLVEGSFDTLSSALSNVDAAFFMSENVTGGASNEVAQGRAISSALASVRDSGEKVPHVVYSSVDGAERGTGIPHFESKWEIEKLLRRVVGAEGMTVLRPVAFMNNFPKRSGEALSPLWGAFDVVVGGKKLQWVSTSDIGVAFIFLV